MFTLEDVRTGITDLEDEINKTREVVEKPEVDLNMASPEVRFLRNERFAGPTEGGSEELSSSRPGPSTPWDGSCDP